MIDFYFQAIFYMGFVCFIVGCLFAIAGLLWASNVAIDLIVRRMKLYPVLVDFIWDYNEKKRRGKAA